MTDPLNQLIEKIKEGVTQKYAGTDYVDSYIAFLDILGMKNLIERPYNDIRAIFNAAESGRELYGEIQVASGESFIAQNHLKMTIMSDAIILSIDSKIELALSKLIGFSSYLIHSLLMVLDYPIFVRGGITRGAIFHDDNIVFGPGLVSAYNLENEIANSMRCVVSNTLDTDQSFQQYIMDEGSALIRDPSDDIYFINFARPELIEQLSNYAQQTIESDVNDVVKSKYRWLSSYLSGWE